MLGQYENLSVKGVQEWHIAAELLSGNSGANVTEYSDIGSTRRSKADVDKLVDRSMPIFCPGAGIDWDDARWTRNMKSVQIVNRACLPHNMLKQNFPIMIGSVKAPDGDDEQLLAAMGDADAQVEGQHEMARAGVAAESQWAASWPWTAKLCTRPTRCGRTQCWAGAAHRMPKAAR